MNARKQRALRRLDTMTLPMVISAINAKSKQLSYDDLTDDQKAQFDAIKEAQGR
jgi:hypothetical protein